MERTTRRRLAALAALAVFLLLVEFAPPVQRLLAPALRAAAPVERSLYTATRAVRQRLARLFLGVDAAARLTALEAEVAALAFDRARLERLEEERTALAALVRWQEATPHRIVGARVVGEDPAAPGAVLRLGFGLAAGIEPGAAVVSPTGSLVGVVQDVGSVTSTMALLKHPSTKLPVRLLARPGAVGLLESPDGLSLLMTEVRKDVVLSIGDVVVTSLGRAGVPPNLPVGTVLAIERQPQGLWQEVAVAPLVEPATLDVVAVLLPP